MWAVESLVSVGITLGFCSPELLVGGALAWNQLEVIDFKWPSKDRGLFEAE